MSVDALCLSRSLAALAGQSDLWYAPLAGLSRIIGHLAGTKASRRGSSDLCTLCALSEVQRVALLGVQHVGQHTALARTFAPFRTDFPSTASSRVPFDLRSYTLLIYNNLHWSAVVLSAISYQTSCLPQGACALFCKHVSMNDGTGDLPLDRTADDLI